MERGWRESKVIFTLIVNRCIFVCVLLSLLLTFVEWERECDNKCFTIYYISHSALDAVAVSHTQAGLAYVQCLFLAASNDDLFSLFFRATQFTDILSVCDTNAVLKLVKLISLSLSLLWLARWRKEGKHKWNVAFHCVSCARLVHLTWHLKLNFHTLIHFSFFSFCVSCVLSFSSSFFFLLDFSLFSSTVSSPFLCEVRIKRQKIGSLMKPKHTHTHSDSHRWKLHKRRKRKRERNIMCLIQASQVSVIIFHKERQRDERAKWTSFQKYLSLMMSTSVLFQVNTILLPCLRSTGSWALLPLSLLFTWPADSASSVISFSKAMNYLDGGDHHSHHLQLKLALTFHSTSHFKKIERNTQWIQ